MALVAEHSHTSKPMIYKISGTWGNHEGSLLMWILILSIFSAGLALTQKKMPLAQKSITLGPGEIKIYKDLILEENEIIRVKPGTIFNFQGNYSIIIKGKIYIEGTKNDPVKFFSDNIKWGTLALLGNKTSGSIIKNATFKNGSFSNFSNIDLSGMISIYNSDNVSISDVKIYNNF